MQFSAAGGSKLLDLILISTKRINTKSSDLQVFFKSEDDNDVVFLLTRL